MPEKFPATKAEPKEKTALSREMEKYISGELGREVSPERKAELNRTLTAAADFFAGAGVDYFVAGGSGIDLMDGTWDRDHQDLDVAVFRADSAKVFEAASKAGYLITDHDRRPLEAEELASPALKGAVLFRSDDGATTEFDLILMDQTKDGDIQVAHGVTASRESFRDTLKTPLEGREIILQPPEVIAFNKLMDGRRKDFEDVRKIWTSMSREWRSRLESFVHDAGCRFVVEGQEVTDVEILLSLAAKSDQSKQRTFYQHDLTQFESELTDELMQKCGELFELHAKAADKAAFFEAVVEKYHGFLPERRAMIVEIADFLYHEPAPTLGAFQTWARKFLHVDDRLQMKALHEYVSQKLWEVKTEQS